MAAAALLTGAFVQPAPAQQNLNRQLQSASRVDCVFTQVARGDWRNAEAALAAEPVEYAASFYAIDVEGGTAEAEGRFGASYIVVRYAEGYLHFMQTLNSGPLYLTTVFAEPAQDGRLKAVHTRHEYTAVSLPGYTSRPEMYIGDCALESAQD